MKSIKIMSFLLLITLGIFLIIFGEADDSPGAQGLGVIGVIIGTVGTYKQVKK